MKRYFQFHLGAHAVLISLATALIAYLILVPLFMLLYGMRACSSSMHQIQKELEEASEISGASWAYTFVRVILP